jgi:hypothetical protein
VKVTIVAQSLAAEPATVADAAENAEETAEEPAEESASADKAAAPTE